MPISRSGHAPFQWLLDSLDDDLHYALEQEQNTPVTEIEDYEEVKEKIAATLRDLRDKPNRSATRVLWRQGFMLGSLTFKHFPGEFGLHNAVFGGSTGAKITLQ